MTSPEIIANRLELGLPPVPDHRDFKARPPDCKLRKGRIGYAEAQEIICRHVNGDSERKIAVELRRSLMAVNKVLTNSEIYKKGNAVPSCKAAIKLFATKTEGVENFNIAAKDAHVFSIKVFSDPALILEMINRGYFVGKRA